MAHTHFKASYQHTAWLTHTSRPLTSTQHGSHTSRPLTSTQHGSHTLQGLLPAHSMAHTLQGLLPAHSMAHTLQGLLPAHSMAHTHFKASYQHTARTSKPPADQTPPQYANPISAPSRIRRSTRENGPLTTQSADRVYAHHRLSKLRNQLRSLDHLCAHICTYGAAQLTHTVTVHTP